MRSGKNPQLPKTGVRTNPFNGKSELQVKSIFRFSLISGIQLLKLVSEPQNAYAWFQRSLAHQQLGETAEAELATAERAYAVGDEMQAHIFATRAQEELERGTEAWVRATEILAVTRPDTREMREWNRRERERRPNFQPQSRQMLLQP